MCRDHHCIPCHVAITIAQLANHLVTTTKPDSELEPCGTKCVVLIVVAVFLAIANAIAITVIVKKMIDKKKELKVRILSQS